MGNFNLNAPRPPARRTGVATDDHGQPLQPTKPRPYRRQRQPQGSNPWPIIVLILLLVVLLPTFVEMIERASPETFLKGGGLAMLWLIPVALILILLFQNIVIVQQETAYIIERLGKFHKIWMAGLHIKIPIIDRVANRVSLKEQVLDFMPQSVITKDNVSMKIDTVVYLHIRDPKLVTYGVQDAIPAIENLTATTLRNLIGELTLDETLTSRDTVNVKMQTILDEATDPWGIKVNRVELKNILPPQDIQEAMEKEMRAEREKRARILEAEGQKTARILEAEAVKESTILEAQAAKERVILEAEGAKQSAIARSEGQAEAIRKVKQAEADGIQMIREAGADSAVVKLRSLDALERMADGKATKLVIPADLAGLAGGLAALKEDLEKPQ